MSEEVDRLEAMINEANGASACGSDLGLGDGEGESIAGGEDGGSSVEEF